MKEIYAPFFWSHSYTVKKIIIYCNDKISQRYLRLRSEEDERIFFYNVFYIIKMI